MQWNDKHLFTDQNDQISHDEVQPDNTVKMANTVGMFIDLAEKRARLEEIMQADHDASQLEQYLLENSQRTDINSKSLIFVEDDDSSRRVRPRWFKRKHCL